MKKLLLLLAIALPVQAEPTYSKPVSSTICEDGYKFVVIQAGVSFQSHQLMGMDGNPMMCGERLKAYNKKMEEIDKVYLEYVKKQQFRFNR